MDRASHFSSEERSGDDEDESRMLEDKLRPISGLRNHLKRNMSATQTSRYPPFDFIKDSDKIDKRD